MKGFNCFSLVSTLHNALLEILWEFLEFVFRGLFPEFLSSRLKPLISPNKGDAGDFSA